MKILVLGNGDHGKDTLAEMLRDMYGLTFQSSSRAAFQHAIWPELWPWYPIVTTLRDAQELCYEERRENRAEWKRLISKFNTPDKARLVKQVLSESDIYVGLRCDEEYEASKHLFDLILYVFMPGREFEPEMKIEFDPGEMTPIINIEGNRNAMRDQLIKVFGQPQ